MKISAQKHSNSTTFSVSSFVICYLLSVICLASCADIFQERIPSSGKNASLDNLFGNEETITKLQRPLQLYVAPYYSSTEIPLTWAPVRGAAYYMVERATISPDKMAEGVIIPEEGDYEVLDRFVYNTYYTDVILKNASLDAPENKNKYFYRVSAFNTAKKYDESDPTNPVSAMLFTAPAKLEASGGTSTEYVELSWEKTEGATFYEILRSNSSDGTSASSLGTVTSDQQKYQNKVSADQQGKDFYYMVRAINSSGKTTPLTKPAYGYARIFGAPNAPVVRLAANSGRGQSTSEIKIEWDPAVEAGVYYAVYRYSSDDSSLTLRTAKTETPNYTDKTFKPGVYYYYQVQAIVDDMASGKALKSAFSFLKKSDKDIDEKTQSFILSPPDTVVAVKNSDNTVTVKWKPAIGNEGERSLYKYNVYADTKRDGDFINSIASDVAPSVDGEGYISAPGLFMNSGAFFKVSTVNSSGVVSEKSAVVSPAPAAAVIQGATQRAYFSDSAFVANNNGVYPVKITWKKPANETPAFYNIQRSTSSGSGFSKINDAELDANGPFINGYSYDVATETYTYIDKNDTAKAGRKFYYRVLSLNELKQGNFYSSEAIGYGALTHEQYILEYNKTMGAALKKLTLMYKSGNTDKLGSETKGGAIKGSIYYNAAISGLGARIIIRLTDYADFYIENVEAKGVYFTLNGESNTSANMSSNGTMDGTVSCTGMYPGKIYYDRIEIKGGAAGGGTYGVEPDGELRKEVPYKILN